MRNKKNGPPIIAVTIPMGRVEEVTVFATISANTIKDAPIDAEAGIRYLLSDPTKMRAIWGETSPINAMIPVKLTTPAATMEMVINIKILMRSTLTPRLFATISPEFIALRYLERYCSTIDPMSTITNITDKLSQLDLFNVPTVHSYAAPRAVGLAFNMRYVVIALNINIKDIPANIIIAGVAFLCLDIRTIKITGTRDNMNALSTIP
jgi:hypothetical protein